MVRDVCAQCPAHGHTDINFQSVVRNRVTSRKKRSDILSDPIGDYDLIFPVGRFLSQKTFEGYNYIPVVEVPGFVLMTVTRNKKFYAKVVASSLFDCWPYFIIYISMMLLAGIMLWILVSKRALVNKGWCGAFFAREVWCTTNARNVSYTPNLTGGKHTISAFVDQDPFTAYSPTQENIFFSKLVFQ